MNWRWIGNECMILLDFRIVLQKLETKLNFYQWIVRDCAPATNLSNMPIFRDNVLWLFRIWVETANFLAADGLYLKSEHFVTLKNHLRVSKKLNMDISTNYEKFLNWTMIHIQFDVIRRVRSFEWHKEKGSSRYFKYILMKRTVLERKCTYRILMELTKKFTLYVQA